MWTSEEHALFAKATRRISQAEYADGLTLADRLLGLVGDDPLKSSYVLGCKKAVALRHLGQPEAAATAFAEAYKLAMDARELAIASCILNAWSSIYEDCQEALAMVREAISLRLQGRHTPDTERALRPDLAYLYATEARILARGGDPRQARKLIIQAKRTLKSYAYNGYPGYKHAYMTVLTWELDMHGRDLSTRGFIRSLRLLSVVALEIARQGKIKEATNLLPFPHKRR